jgi:hypothetical protein
MKKLLAILLLLVLTLTGCAGFDLHFNKYAEQTTRNG